MQRGYVWNPRTCACECIKDCDIGEYLNDCTCMKCFGDDLHVMRLRMYQRVQ